MKMSDMLMKKYYKVQLIAKSKTFKITKQVFNTKSEGLEKGISKGYDILNYKALSRLLTEGWTEYQSKDENVTEQATERQNVIIDLTGNEDIESQIKAYEQAKIERDILAYAEKKRKEEAIKNFLNTPPKQPTYESFDYSKQLDKFVNKQAPRNQRDKQRQIADYCNEEVTV
jgi:hypothetical protein